MLSTCIEVQSGRQFIGQEFLPRDMDTLDVEHVIIARLIREQTIVGGCYQLDAHVLERSDDLSAGYTESPPCLDRLIPPAADKQKSRVLGDSKRLSDLGAIPETDAAVATAIEFMQWKHGGFEMQRFCASVPVVDDRDV
jgi:hypothetical protein